MHIMNFILLYVFFCKVGTTSTEHTLQYLYTLRSAPEDGPEFQITSVFDGLIISHCESPTFRDQSRHDWIHQAFTVEEWKSRDRFCEGEFYFNKERIKQIVNITRGIIQRERRCTVDDSAVYISDRWGVNGEDFLTLDPNTLKWNSYSSIASTIQSKWNQLNYMVKSVKDFELNQCKPSLMKLKMMKEDYVKKSPRPEVYIFGKSSSDRDTVFLRCYVSHKYLPGIRVRLTLDGVIVDKNVNITSPATNMDGTVQIRLQTETSIKEPDRYHCAVDADNLHFAIGWDGRTLNQMNIPDQFVLLDFTKLWVTFILLLIFGGITCCSILALQCFFLLCKRADTQGNTNIYNEVQYFLSLNLKEEEWRRAAEADDEFYGHRWKRSSL